jgi:hypothetical protein
MYRSLSFGPTLVLALTLPALAGQSAPPPADLVTIDVGGDSLTLWPFTTASYQTSEAGRSDPINLVFLDTDPRAIRQELLGLGSDRPAWSFLPRGANGCVWMDAMGNEQAAFLEPEGWIGGEVQLACATPDSPLGREYRFHVRLFRSGAHTIGGAHFEINVPGTAEHEVLSWELARRFVTDEIARLDSGAFLVDTPVFQPANGAFRTARGLVNAYVWQTNAGNPQFLQALGLPPPQPPFPPVPIPATGLAAVFDPAFAYAPVSSDVTLTDSRTYFVQSTAKPFCDGAPIQITGGPVTLVLRVRTNPSGKYQRTYTIAGQLEIKTLSTGVIQDALVAEGHHAMLTDHHEQLTEVVSQTLLPTDSAPGQSLNQALGAGNNDYFVRLESCAIE